MVKIYIICGHYGSGKTNFAVNFAEKLNASGGKTVLLDMDVVNPYFRSGDYSEVLEGQGIHVIAPVSLGTTIDAPYLSAEIDSVFTGLYDTVIIDAGGDDAGATALGVYSGKIIDACPDYEMYYIINMYRQMTQDADSAVEILHEIEAAAHLKATKIINNSHLCALTTAECINASVGFADKICEKTALPLEYTAVTEGVEGVTAKNIFSVKRVVLPPW